MTLIKAIKNKDLLRVKELIDAGAEIDKMYDGFLPMYVAIKIDAIEIVDLLLAKGAKVDVVGSWAGERLLHVAMKNAMRSKNYEKSIEIMKKLLHHGANPNHKHNTNGMPFITEICANQTLSFARTMELIDLLLEYGADINACCIVTPMTALHAVEEYRKNNKERLRSYLQSKGAI